MSIKPAQRLIDEVVAHFQIANGTSREFAESCVRPVLMSLSKIYGGGRLYIPKIARDRAAVMMDIAARLPIRQICRKHGVSPGTVYRLMARRQATSRAP